MQPMMYLLIVACGRSVLEHPDICSVQAGSAEVVIEEIEMSNSGKNPPDCTRVLERTSQGLDSSEVCQPSITMELSSLGVWSPVVRT